jgi:pyruvate kinase
MFPLRAVAVMDSIARSVEPTLAYERRIAPSETVAEILTHGACDLADDVGAAVIAVPTKTGATARLVSRFRPQGPIVAAATSAVVLQQLALEWAVVPLQVGEALTIEAGWADIIVGLVGRGLAQHGDTIVLTGRSNLPLVGATNHVFVHRVETVGTSPSIERLSRRLRTRAAREAVAGG